MRVRVPRFQPQVARPAFFLAPVAGMPRPAFKWHTQVNNESWRAMPSTSSGTPSFAWLSLVLVCHAWVFKWHAQVSMRAGVPRLRHQVARPGAWTFNLFSGNLYWRATP
ncbi:hypothetical protein AHAS_Ahas18G0170800 [Arachis hypogaea]